MQTIFQTVLIIVHDVLSILDDDIALLFPRNIHVFWIHDIGVSVHLGPIKLLQDLIHISALTFLQDGEEDLAV